MKFLKNLDSLPYEISRPSIMLYQSGQHGIGKKTTNRLMESSIVRKQIYTHTDALFCQSNSIENSSIQSMVLEQLRKQK